jgi:two-component system CheB/CheR fusion protein
LPLHVSSPADDVTPAPLQIPERGSRVLRILVVEDHGDTAEMIKKVLNYEGHEVQVARDVETALEKVSQDSFDMLISDLGLPDGSGLDLMRELRARGQQIPAIALSGYGQENDIQMSRDAGFAVHITKPVDMERLLSSINLESARV